MKKVGDISVEDVTTDMQWLYIMFESGESVIYGLTKEQLIKLRKASVNLALALNKELAALGVSPEEQFGEKTSLGK